ncbi:hypothetical protein [Yoonia algicola]|uniref:Uncharacterized protein n=1 Tax=Yoonia algicola TaxID=3137368 RepID=A0AAN0NFR0_9RHOB
MLSSKVFRNVSVGLFLALISVTSAFAGSWEDAIEDVEAKADRYWEFGRSRGAFTWLGTAYNELGIPQHQCAILGRMLGFEEHIRHLEEFDDPELRPDLSEDELQQLMYHSHFLSNWVFTARRLVGSSDDTRQQIWNLDCVGHQGIPDSLFVGLADSSAKLIVAGNDIRVLGDFEVGFYQRFEQFVEANPQAERIVLGSGGGSVRDAIMTGLLIRRLGLATTLSQNCYSACPLAFLGGVDRTIWSPYPKLGFHRVSRADGAQVSFDEPVYETIELFVSEMGANPDFVMRHIFAAAPTEFSYPELDDLCKAAVTTWIQRLCSSDD